MQAPITSHRFVILSLMIKDYKKEAEFHLRIQPLYFLYQGCS